ncbi:MAG: hypothetical protein ACREQ1_02015, partial [Woeseiaceae bacterium]
SSLCFNAESSTSFAFSIWSVIGSKTVSSSYVSTVASGSALPPQAASTNVMAIANVMFFIVVPRKM